MASRRYLRNQAVLQGLLKQARRQARLTQAGLARRLGQPQSFVSKYESGERRLDVLEIRQVCKATGLSLATFIRRLEGAVE